MNLDGLFVETIEDLRHRCDLRATEYDMVQASGLIRRLLIDKTALWYQVNRQFKTKPKLVWGGIRTMSRETESLQASVAGIMLDPIIAESLAIASVSEQAIDIKSFVRSQNVTGNFDEFLSFGVIVRTFDYPDGTSYRQDIATLRDLIKHYANCGGGVHYDPNGKSSNELVEEVRQVADEVLRLTIIACGRVIIRALEPMAAVTLLKDRKWPAGFDFR